MSTVDLQILEPGTERPINFTLAPAKTGQLITLETVDWEPTDGKVPWRLALHPWAGGLAPSRIQPRITLAGALANRPSMVYAKASGDASNENFFTASPKITTITPTLVSIFFNDVIELEYDTTYYGMTSYMGAAAAASPIFIGVRNFNNKAYFGGGQYLYSIDSSYTFNIVKDFGTGKAITDIEPFNNELVIAMGETENIWTMDTSEVFTQSSDSVFATSLGRSENLLWRSRAFNLISNCIDTPLTLTSWVPSAGNEDQAGDTTYAITDLIEYGGSIAVVRPDGVYFPDAEAKFHNQTPQLQTYPDPENGIGSFVAKGHLYVPSIAGLLQVTYGESVPVGPELSHRPDFRFRVRGGVEWNSDIYVICTDEAQSEETFICKMRVDISGLTSNQFIYDEWLRLGSTAISRVIVIYTAPVNPTMIATLNTDLVYWKMGRGLGPDVDDSNYEFATTFLIEPGDIMAASDLATKVDLVGVKIVANQIVDGTIKVEYDVDKTGIFKDMLSNQDGSGETNIQTSGVIARNRYAPPNTSGHNLRIRVSGTMPSGQLGKNRTELLEVWAFGNAIPDGTDIITVNIYADRAARFRGLRQGRNANGVWQKFSDWMANGTIIEARIPEYSPDQHVRVKVVEISQANIETLMEGKNQINTNVVKVTLRRVDFSGDLSDND